MSRTEHLDWCKKRALEYLDQGDITNAFASMASDLEKHEETAQHPGIMLGMQLAMAGNLITENQMRDFINGFN
jgi:hypothetical protein